MKSIHDELSALTMASPVNFRNLTVLPLLRNDAPAGDPDYLLLDDAIRLNFARVTEVDGGTVPELRFENRADQPVLLLDGQELLGAKQNRVLNLTILAPPKQTLSIPVSCVEAGRWYGTSAEFRSADWVQYCTGRAARTEQVSQSIRYKKSRRSNQPEVWQHIAFAAARLSAHSPTQAMSAIFERHAVKLEEYTRSFVWQEKQAGAAFSINGSVMGFDLFDHPSTMRRVYPKLIRSYALDALDAAEAAPGHQQAGSAPFEEFLSAAGACPSFCETAIGLGKDVRLTGGSLSGAALWAEGRYIHLYAFARPEGKPQHTDLLTRISRPSRRRFR